MNKRSFAVALALLTITSGVFHERATIRAQAPRGVPRFEVQAGWAKIPAKWKLGDVSSVAADARDNVWVLHRPHTLTGEDLKAAAPPVLQFDSNGNFLQAWGGPGTGFDWPEREHGIHVDQQNNVWIGGNNCIQRNEPGLKPVDDDQLMKFTSTGKFVLQIGRANSSTGNADTKNLHLPSDVVVYRNEAYVADGYGNHRVIVFDATTGAFKRMWGAFGNKPMDRYTCPPGGEGAARNDGTRGPEQFGILHAIRISNDGLVYAADRSNNRVQVFTPEGKYLNQVLINREDGKPSQTAGALAFSGDPQQTYLYASGSSAGSTIAVIDRKSLKVLSLNVGPGGHHIGNDSKGNLFTAFGAPGHGPTSVQKLVFKGVS